MIRIKPGVTFSHNTFRIPEAMRILWVAQYMAPDGYEITITSGMEGEHAKGSAHYAGKAFDLRTRDLDHQTVGIWAHRIQAALGDQYFVLVEETHMHIQVNI